MSLFWQEIILVMLLSMKLAFTDSQPQSMWCTYGDVRLVNGNVTNEGRVEVCFSSMQWGTVCDDEWSSYDAQVVCRQLGYESDGAQALGGAYFGQGTGRILLTDVRCNPREHNYLLECDKKWNTQSCDHSKDASVRCYQSRVSNVSVTTTNEPSSELEYNTALITWKITNTTVHFDRLSWYELICHSINGSSHRMEVLVRKTSLSTYLGGFFLSSAYVCCVSEVYDVYYVTRSTCAKFNNGQATSTSSISMSAALGSNSSNTIGGVLGFIIILLLILLILSVIANVCLLQPGLRKKVLPTKLARFVDSRSRSSSTLPVRANISYVTTTPQSRSTTENTYNNDRARGQPEGVTPAASSQHYSSIGPAYESLSSTTGQGREQRQDGGRRREIPISERYEFADIHTDTDHHVQVGVGASDYEVPRESVNLGHDDYSHLQHR